MLKTKKSEKKVVMLIIWNFEFFVCVIKYDENMKSSSITNRLSIIIVFFYSEIPNVSSPSVLGLKIRY